VLFIVQSPYWSTIGCRGVFSLGGWTPHLQPGFPEPEFTLWANQLPATGLSPSPVRHSNASLFHWLVRFRSPLLTESRLLSFPTGTEMFQFPAFALHPYAFRVKYPCGWVAPFGNPRITAWLPAPLGLSQVPASFIASRHQDIRHVPLCSVTPTGHRGFGSGFHPYLSRFADRCHPGAPRKGHPSRAGLRDPHGQHVRLSALHSTFLQLLSPHPATPAETSPRPRRGKPRRTPRLVPQNRLGDMFIRIRLSKSRRLRPGLPGFQRLFSPFGLSGVGWGVL
jgi:hypothetical protein